MAASLITELILGAVAVVFLATILALAVYLTKEKAALKPQIAELNQARKHLEEALLDLGRKTSEISIFYEIAARGIYPLDYFVSRLAEMMGAETVEILLFEDRNKLKTAAAYGFPAPEIPPAAVLVIPLLHEGKKIGELSLARFIKKEFSRDEKRILAIIVERVVGAIEEKKAEAERKKLEKSLKEKVSELQKFHDLAVGRELKMIELEKEIERLKGSPGDTRDEQTG